MRTITIIYQRDSYLYRWLKPLFNAKKEFKKLGYKIQYQSILDYVPFLNSRLNGLLEKRSLTRAQKKKYDIVMMAFHHSTSSFFIELDDDQRKNILTNIRKNCNELVWLDTADSTGTCKFEVLPYVDLYLKKQLLKDKSLYYKDLYGGRFFCDFYHNLLQIEDDALNVSYAPLDPKYLSKIGLAWNVGIGDLYANTPWQLFAHPFSVTIPDFISADKEKTLDLQYRGTGYSPIAGYPRSESKRQLSQLSGITVSDYNKTIPKAEYIKEGQNAKSILSPFGWGEICGRDFEALVYGACMIKQSMDTIETYPPLYKEMETYVPLKWDFTDFRERVLKSGSEEYRKIARKAQDSYKFYFTEEGRMDFAKHIVNQIEGIQNERR